MHTTDKSQLLFNLAVHHHPDRLKKCMPEELWAYSATSVIHSPGPVMQVTHYNGCDNVKSYIETFWFLSEHIFELIQLLCILESFQVAIVELCLRWCFFCFFLNVLREAAGSFFCQTLSELTCINTIVLRLDVAMCLDFFWKHFNTKHSDIID